MEQNIEVTEPATDEHIDAYCHRLLNQSFDGWSEEAIAGYKTALGSVIEFNRKPWPGQAGHLYLHKNTKDLVHAQIDINRAVWAANEDKYFNSKQERGDYIRKCAVSAMLNLQDFKRKNRKR